MQCCRLVVKGETNETGLRFHQNIWRAIHHWPSTVICYCYLSDITAQPAFRRLRLNTLKIELTRPRSCDYLYNIVAINKSVTMSWLWHHHADTGCIWLHAAVRLVYDLHSREHVSTTTTELYWLPVEARTQFKLCLLVHLSLIGNAPSYITHLLQPVSTISSCVQSCIQPPGHICKYWERVWNSDSAPSM